MGAARATMSGGLFRSPKNRQLWRQFILFLAMLMSGGLLIFPRATLLVVLIAACSAYASPVRLLRREFSFLWLLLIAVAAIALVGGLSFQLGFMAIRYANFFGGLMILMLYVDEAPEALPNDLMPILRLMAVQAILTPIAAILLSNYFFSFGVRGEEVYRTFLFIFTYHDTGVDSGWFRRADGFFYEPGVFQMYLNIYLFMSLFMFRLRWLDVGLAVGGVIATLSTTGAVLMMLIVGVAYLRYLATATLNAKILFLLLAPLLLLPALYAAQNVNEKFTGSARGSAWAREYDLRTGLAVIAESPLTGIGFDYERYYELAYRVGYRETQLSRENISERSNSNGIVTLFYSMGIPQALIFLWGLFRQRFFRPRLLGAAIVFISLLTEALAFTPFVLMVMFSGLLLSRKRRARTIAAPLPARP